MMSAKFLTGVYFQSATSMQIFEANIRSKYSRQILEANICCKKANITLNRKMLSEIAINDPQGFAKLVETAKAAR